VTDAAADIEDDAPLAPGEPLFVTDSEMVKLLEKLGVPRRTARATIKYLDANPERGFPPKQILWGERRHWPNVKRYLAKTCAGRMGVSSKPRGPHA
jgi:hypothetical protein